MSETQLQLTKIVENKMTPLESLRSIFNESFQTEDGQTYTVQLLPALSENEIENLRNTLPNKFIPRDIVELLKFSRGFLFDPLEQISFNAFGEFGFEELFPNSIQLAGDGAGNFWVLDIDSKGNWGAVYYVCHDPAVIVKHSANLAEFISDVSELGEKGSESKLATIQEKIVYDIWNTKQGIMELNEKEDYDFGNMPLPEFFIIADLSDKPVKSGFAWGKFGSNTKIIRPNEKPIWVLEKQIKQGFLAKLFNFKRSST